MYLNKAQVIGNLTAKPEQKMTEGGTAITKFSVATNRTYTDNSGQKQEDAEFHNVVVFGKQAENCAKYLEKGQQAYVEGRLSTSSWESDGVTHYRTEIVAHRVQFGRKPGGSEYEQAAQGVSKQKPQIDYPDEDITPESIPF